MMWEGRMLKRVTGLEVWVWKEGGSTENEAWRAALVCTCNEDQHAKVVHSTCSLLEFAAEGTHI